MTTVAQVMAEVGRLHMENLELRTLNEALATRLQAAEKELERKAADKPARKRNGRADPESQEPVA